MLILIKLFTYFFFFVVDGTLQAQSFRRGDVKHGFSSSDRRSDGILHTHSFLYSNIIIQKDFIIIIIIYKVKTESINYIIIWSRLVLISIL